MHKATDLYKKRKDLDEPGMHKEENEKEDRSN